MPWPRAAIDTAILWAALSKPDASSRRLVERWYDGEFDLVMTEEIREEYQRKLLSPEYVERYDNRQRVEEFFTYLNIFRERVEPAPPEDLPAIRDEKDVMWLAAAIGGKAQYLVTYDNDFLQDVRLIREMRKRGTRIVRPRNFHEELDRS